MELTQRSQPLKATSQRDWSTPSPPGTRGGSWIGQGRALRSTGRAVTGPAHLGARHVAARFAERSLPSAFAEVWISGLDAAGRALQTTGASWEAVRPADPTQLGLGSIERLHRHHSSVDLNMLDRCDQLPSERRLRAGGHKSGTPTGGHLIRRAEATIGLPFERPARKAGFGWTIRPTSTSCRGVASSTSFSRSMTRQRNRGFRWPPAGWWP